MGSIKSHFKMFTRLSKALICLNLVETSTLKAEYKRQLDAQFPEFQSQVKDMNFHVVFGIVALIGSALGKHALLPLSQSKGLVEEGAVEDHGPTPKPRMSMNKEEEEGIFYISI